VRTEKKGSSHWRTCALLRADLGVAEGLAKIVCMCACGETASCRWRIVEGDEVVVRGTQFSGQIGKVLAVLRDPRVPQVVVEGVNLVSGGSAEQP